MTKQNQKMVDDFIKEKNGGLHKVLTKQQQKIVHDYISTNNRGLYECYEKPSDAKQIIYYRIVDEMNYNNGYDLRIIFYNPFVFTVAYCYINDNGLEVLVYHTPTRKQEIILQ